MPPISSWKIFERYLGLITKMIGIFLFSFIFIRFFIVSSSEINGPSMEPTFVDEDYFFVNRFIYLFVPPKRYDIIQIINLKEKKHIVKRIIGLPGETVILRGGSVYISKNNGSAFFTEKLDESSYLPPYTLTLPFGTEGVVSYYLQDNEYFVLGDNRNNSIDSREYGPILRSNIVGRVIKL
ncbi:MAG: signal peptidase I [Candidatus Magasanikbacteria bacterium CG11_big_fil_rev_8_21_14_0_20_39_34]|uniref:Signal peptidase I n=1 Tax=Candidatus Magasanikbacteria bacterium CG11_big_fil_rev_8_21_14_0_20_39_34 TaxID=1974653 RepID=A0A2H0N4T1_9BACT|nr:MAG: signal peptidase I [Candidatus Magasanikbacteria bacterium CG11_big_fil_rev_8_21_14_0_20_39_34]